VIVGPSAKLTNYRKKVKTFATVIYQFIYFKKVIIKENAN